MRRATLGVVLSASACALLACVPTRTAPIDLYRADTKVVRFALKNPRSTICPGQPVALDVELDALVDGELLHLKQHRYDLDDWIFEPRQLHLTSAQGSFGDDGKFYPSPDVTVSAQTGFVIFLRAPHGPAFSVRFPPAYECTASLGGAGRSGAPGAAGEDAIAADKDVDVASGDDPLGAARGKMGQNGGPGSEGPRFSVYITWVRTPDYTRLLAARSFGAVQTLTLVAPGTPLVVRASGGEGGAGGRGGQGGTGLARSSSRRSVVFAPGGRGGTGGSGGTGGAGGEIDVFIDERFDELERMVVADVDGGAGGPGGPPGKGGEPGRAGNSGRRSETSQRGDPGASGVDGKRGPAGRARFARADVRARFAGLGALVPY